MRFSQPAPQNVIPAKAGIQSVTVVGIKKLAPANIAGLDSRPASWQFDKITVTPIKMSLSDRGNDEERTHQLLNEV